MTSEVRKIDSRSMATIGVLSNQQKNIKIGKAGGPDGLEEDHIQEGVMNLSTTQGCRRR